MMKILKFEWDNQKGEDCNGKHLMIGQYLPRLQNNELTHLEIYGISLDIIDTSKDYQLKRLSCYQENIVSDVKEISKEDARTILMQEIDKALDVLYDTGNTEEVNENLNIEIEEAELEDDE